MTACPYVAGTLIFIYRGIAHSALSMTTTIYSTYLHLKVKTIIEFFIVKLEQSFVLEVEAIIRLARNQLHINI